LGRSDHARTTLQKAVALAAPDHVLLPFVENGDHIAAPMAELKAQNIYPEFAGQILELLAVGAKTRETVLARASGGGRSLPLSPREWTIAELVATGLSNRVIAETLHLAEVTVKKALQSIYLKLEINSRTALARLVIEQKAN
ncbi:MAG TPA: LuxR C-terminal-related transcriptional regulator, partial [Patescibacteria group bacterium]|nr:LuxR C-terminal-related transcriptional regulator [Patescibacteria group bacterium]